MSDGSIWSKIESMGALASSHKIIFFLNSGQKLPPFYIQLAQELTYRDISLVPIAIDHIPLFLKQHKFIRVICSVTNFSERETFKTIATGIIPTLIRQGRIQFFHFSSFDQSLQVSTTVHREHYHFVKLPEKFSEICNLIEASFYVDSREPEIWPGGAKSAVPKLTYKDND